MTQFDIIAFDADDTLWHNESLYADVQTRFAALIAPYCQDCAVEERLYETEIRNLQHYGYGIKAFILSLIETAIEMTGARIPARDIGAIIAMGREMLDAQVTLLDHVPETVAALARDYPLMVITKGDLRDQEAKVARSGLQTYFKHIEIVSDKTPDAYAAILRRHGIAPARFLMVGNSLRSDILPVIEIGGRAVYMPYETTWAHEHVDPSDAQRARYHQIAHLGELPGLIERLAAELSS
jgi:putative hydrolase of the HAD superfamily